VTGITLDYVSFFCSHIMNSSISTVTLIKKVKGKLDSVLN